MAAKTAGKTEGVKQTSRKNYYQGVQVRPVKYYNGSTHGFMAGSINGECIRDSAGKVLPYRSIPFDNNTNSVNIVEDGNI